jgi:hypothetical protein
VVSGHRRGNNFRQVVSIMGPGPPALFTGHFGTGTPIDTQIDTQIDTVSAGFMVYALIIDRHIA